MGVAVDQLAAKAVNDVLHGEAASLRFHLGVEDDLHQDISQLLAEGGHVVVVNGLHGLAGLLQEVAADGLVGLLGVPGAAAGGPEDAHDGQHILVAVVFLLKIYHIFGLIARTLRFFAAFPAAFAGIFLPQRR